MVLNYSYQVIYLMLFYLSWIFIRILDVYYSKNSFEHRNNSITIYYNSENETSRNGRWMFGRTLAFVIDLTVASLMANVRTKEKVNSNHRSVAKNFPRGGARQRENLLALRIIFQPCTPLQPFFLQGVCPGTLCTPPGYAPVKKVEHNLKILLVLLRNNGQFSILGGRGAHSLISTFAASD
jgi:hypothetical protein